MVQLIFRTVFLHLLVLSQSFFLIHKKHNAGSLPHEAATTRITNWARNARSPTFSSLCLGDNRGNMADVFGEISKLAERAGRPAHVGIPRKRMELPFAVLLMRSSYNAVDEMDFFPMDEFQKNFFLFRQDEWEGYKGYHPTVMQGDLADPLYFDFISFAQYAVIDSSCRGGLFEFVEKTGANGTSQVVRRDTSALPENGMLPTVHSKTVGRRILSYLAETYPPSILPTVLTEGDRSSSSSLSLTDGYLADAQLVMDLFAVNSYCLKATVSKISAAKGKGDEGGTRKNGDGKESDGDQQIYLQVALDVPATLWSQQALARRKNSPLNNFEVKALSALAERSGLTLEVLSSRVEQQIRIVHDILVYSSA